MHVYLRGGLVFDEHEFLERRVRWLADMSEFIKPGVIAELGCGSGFVLDFLTARYPDSRLIGVDILMSRLEQVLSKRQRNISVVNADMNHSLFADGSVDTILIVSTLHIISCNGGDYAIQNLLATVHRALKPGGVLILQDYLKPEGASVVLEFPDDNTRARFDRFAKEFNPRHVSCSDTGTSVVLDIADAADFLSSCHSSSEEKWQEAMQESHMIFTKDYLRNLVTAVGLSVVDEKIHFDREIKLFPECGLIKDTVSYDSKWISFAAMKS